jgi:hypothetical protein
VSDAPGYAVTTDAGADLAGEWRSLDFHCRTWAVAWLRLGGLHGAAEALARCRQIRDDGSVASASLAAIAARSAAEALLFETSDPRGRRPFARNGVWVASWRASTIAGSVCERSAAGAEIPEIALGTAGLREAALRAGCAAAEAVAWEAAWGCGGDMDASETAARRAVWPTAERLRELGRSLSGGRVAVEAWRRASGPGQSALEAAIVGERRVVGWGGAAEVEAEVGVSR